MPPTSTIPLLKACIEKDIMKSWNVWSAGASLPLWPAFARQRVRECVCLCLCVCVCAHIAERLNPLGFCPHI